MNVDTTDMCPECGRQRCSNCRTEWNKLEHGPQVYSASIYGFIPAHSHKPPRNIPQEVKDGSQTGAQSWSGLAQQQLDKLDRHTSSSELGRSGPASGQPPDLQGLSLASSASPQQSCEDFISRAEGPESLETMFAGLSAQDRLRLGDDGNDEDERSSRALTPASTSSDEIATINPSKLVAWDQASPQANTPQSGWETVVFPDTSFIDEENLVELFIEVLESIFRNWCGNGMHQAAGEEAADGDSSPSTSSSELPTKGTPGNQHLKRKHPDESGDQDNDDRRRSHSSKKRPRGKSGPLHKMLACHFCKRDPRRHRKCCNFGGENIGRVKQHIVRKHFIGSYCVRCMRLFENVDTLDQHTRLGECQLRDILCRPDGITLEQRAWLHRRVSRGTSEEQRWYAVWDYLFPDVTRPPSPWNNFDLSEDLLDFSNFITSPRGYEILLQNLRRNAAWAEEYETLFGPDLASALGQFFMRWAATRDGRGDQMEVDRGQGLAAGHASPAVPEDSHHTVSDASLDIHPPIPAAGVDGSESENTELSAVPPQAFGAMDEATTQQAITTEVRTIQAIQEGRAGRLTPVNEVPAPDYSMGQMEPVPSLEVVFNRARESRTEDWRLELEEHEELETKEDETAQPPLQLTEHGLNYAGPSIQTLDVATQGFEFLDFEASADILAAAESSFDWDDIDFGSL